MFQVCQRNFKVRTKRLKNSLSVNIIKISINFNQFRHLKARNVTMKSNFQIVPPMNNAVDRWAGKLGCDWSTVRNESISLAKKAAL